jgi:hypothetical protein
MTDEPAAASDSFFGAPEIDVDEWRDGPLPHRYVHGGFGATDTRFSFYLPPREQYRGRFLQFLEGGHGGSEHALTTPRAGAEAEAAPFRLAFRDLGAYLVESNQGHIGNDMSGLRGDWSITWYRASAASARLARTMAGQMYGEPPHHAYVYGPSGGGLRAFWCMEQMPDLWDGAVPYVISPVGLYTLSAHAYGVEGLGDGLEAVVDACDVGGSGDPFAGLTTTQSDALATLYRVGWARGAEAQLRREYIFGFGIQGVRQEDPSYFEDFWTVPGYAGADDPLHVGERLVEGKAVVRRVVRARDLGDDPMAAWLARRPDAPLGVELDGVESDALFGADLALTTGRAAGRRMRIARVYPSGVLVPFTLGVPELFGDVEPGDEVAFDNRDFVAFCYYHRYVDAGPDSPFRVDGRAMHPVRGSSIQRGLTGRISGRMILCPGAIDSNVFPTDAYPRMVASALGERTDDHFRVWWMDHASHGPPAVHRPGPEWDTRLIDYTGIVEQAVRDVVAWVEEDRPPARMHYRFGRDNALVLADDAAERGGVQPVVQLRVDGTVRADVAVGVTVAFEGRVELPPGAGSLVTAQWDFRGDGSWPEEVQIDGAVTSAVLRASHRYTAPGTYFPALRVSAHRDGGVGTGPPVVNLGRVRVLVTPASRTAVGSHVSAAERTERNRPDRTRQTTEYNRAGRSQLSRS